MLDLPWQRFMGATDPPILRLIHSRLRPTQVGQLRSNKPATLYSTDSFVVACCSNPEGSAVISGHIDCRICARRSRAAV